MLRELLDMVGIEGPDGRERRRDEPQKRGIRGFLGRLMDGDDDGDGHERHHRNGDAEGTGRRRKQDDSFDFD